MKYVLQKNGSARFAFLILLGILVALPLALSLHATAHAASCGGSSCDGKDPSDTGCAADAFTTGGIIHLTDTLFIRSELGYAENRYSPSCHTNWTRVTLESCPATSSCLVDINITRQSDGKQEQFFNNDGAGYNVIWTSMVYAPSPQRAQACALLGVSSSVSGGGDVLCSGWR